MTDIEIEKIHRDRKHKISREYGKEDKIDKVDKDDCDNDCERCNDDTCECWWDDYDEDVCDEEYLFRSL